ncbi:dienelactone hydrolase family protein [Paraburkholderia oxyphila]|uniref:dienelactone hydrolase family protein n=1 Tax=Paraburkholderia oxyphila TaxID=614212 RepID=UPI0004841048|nr:alpha/beta hydrolase [Paraburkholderia oxyphila]
MQANAVGIPVERLLLDGMLSVPLAAKGIVVLVHGGASSEHGVGDQIIARSLQDAGFATLCFEILSKDEERRDTGTGEYRFDVALLARRLAKVLDWLGTRPDTRVLPVGLLGDDTGAAAALIVSAARQQVRAMVSRGGRQDLAREALACVTAPTLLIVGEFYETAIRFNGLAATRLRCKHRISIVADASRRFDEPGALEALTRLATEWFLAHLEIGVCAAGRVHGH